MMPVLLQLSDVVPHRIQFSERLPDLKTSDACWIYIYISIYIDIHSLSVHLSVCTSIYLSTCINNKRNNFWWLNHAISSKKWKKLAILQNITLNPGHFVLINPGHFVFTLHSLSEADWHKKMVCNIGTNLFGMYRERITLFNCTKWTAFHVPCILYNLIILDSSGLDSSVASALNSWLKGCGFDSWQKQWKNFLLQSAFSADLTLSLFHPCLTTVACKRPLSFCKKCRWQVIG